MSLSRRTICAVLGALPGLAATRCSPPARRLTFFNWGDYLAPEVVARFAARKDGAEVELVDELEALRRARGREP